MPYGAGDAIAERGCGCAQRSRLAGLDRGLVEKAAAALSARRFAKENTLPNLSPSQRIVPLHYDVHVEFLFPLPALTAAVTLTVQDSRSKLADPLSDGHLPEQAALTDDALRSSHIALNGICFTDVSVASVAIPAAAQTGAPAGAFVYNPTANASASAAAVATGAAVPVSFSYADDVLTVTWSAPFAPGEVRALRIAYAVVAPNSGMTFGPVTQTLRRPAAAHAADAAARVAASATASSASAAAAAAGTSVSAFLTSLAADGPAAAEFALAHWGAEEDGPWVPSSWAGSDHESERCRHWLPVVDQTMAVRSRYDFHVTALEGMTVIVNGIRVSEPVPAAVADDAAVTGADQAPALAALAYPAPTAADRVAALRELAATLAARRRVVTHYRLAFPCPPYLLALGVGYLVKHRAGRFARAATPEAQRAALAAPRAAGENSQLGEVVYYGVPTVGPDGATPGKLARSFRHTVPMLHWLQARLGVAFPFPKYYQLASHGVGGAMENISLVTWNEVFMLDRKAAREWGNFTGIVNIHEMAHSYFGDAVTSRHFDHAWLKESWATYLEYVWLQENIGVEEMLYNMRVDRDKYLAEAQGGYVRAVSTNVYNHSWSMFDYHLYPGGAWRLHMLRAQLGDAVFWDGVRRYLTRHMSVGDDAAYAREDVAGTVSAAVLAPPAETDDFRACLEFAAAAAGGDASAENSPHFRVGHNLTGFFDEWFYGKGFPSVAAEYAYDTAAGVATVTLKQTQDRHATASCTGAYFDLTLPVAFERAPEDWIVLNARFSLADGTARVSLPLTHAPLQVLIDPQHRVLAKVSFTPPLDLLLRTIECVPDYGALYAAARARDGRGARGPARSARFAERGLVCTSPATLPTVAIPLTNGVTRAWAYQTIAGAYSQSAASRAVPLRRVAAAGKPGALADGEFMRGDWIYATRTQTGFSALASSLPADPTPSVHALVAPAIAALPPAAGAADAAPPSALDVTCPAAAAAIAAGARPCSSTVLLLALASAAVRSPAANPEAFVDAEDRAGGRVRPHGGFEHAAAVVGACGAVKSPAMLAGLTRLLSEGCDPAPGDSDGEVSCVESDDDDAAAAVPAPRKRSALARRPALAPAVSGSLLPYRAHAALLGAIAAQGDLASIHTVLLPAVATPGFQGLVQRAALRGLATVLTAAAFSALPDVGMRADGQAPARVAAAAVAAMVEAYQHPAVPLAVGAAADADAAAYGCVSTRNIKIGALAALSAAYAALLKHNTPLCVAAVAGDAAAPGSEALARLATASLIDARASGVVTGGVYTPLLVAIRSFFLTALRSERADRGVTDQLARTAAHTLGGDDEVAAAVRALLRTLPAQDALAVSVALEQKAAAEAERAGKAGQLVELKASVAGLVAGLVEDALKKASATAKARDDDAAGRRRGHGSSSSSSSARKALTVGLIAAGAGAVAALATLVGYMVGKSARRNSNNL